MIPSLVAGALALAFLVILFLRGKAGGAIPPSGALAAATTAKPKAGPGTCTLCGSILGPGERMKSDLFPGSGPRIMRIFGCPHCLGPAETRKRRWCPVCGDELEALDHAIGRYFERPGRRHVHVLGCTRCRKTI